VASGECAQTLGGPATALALAPDGRWLAAAGADCRIRLWDLHTGACAHSLDTAPQRITVLAFSADGRHLAAASTRPAVLVWEIDWELSELNEVC
jgi:WD40 repeat protein